MITRRVVRALGGRVLNERGRQRKYPTQAMFITFGESQVVALSSTRLSAAPRSSSAVLAAEMVRMCTQPLGKPSIAASAASSWGGTPPVA